MRVVIRHTATGLYYAGRRHWVGDPYQAKDLGTIERARELAGRARLDGVEVVTMCLDPARAFAVPLREPKPASDRQAADGAG